MYSVDLSLDLWQGCVSQHAMGWGCLSRGCLPRRDVCLGMCLPGRSVPGGVYPGEVSAWGCLSSAVFTTHTLGRHLPLPPPHTQNKKSTKISKNIFELYLKKKIKCSQNYPEIASIETHNITRQCYYNTQNS